MTDLTSIRNIGPAMAESLQAAGIATAADLRSLGADAAYRQMLQNGVRPHFIMYYVLHMALQGRAWNDCKGAEKNRLRAQFDALKAACTDHPDAAFERILDRIGTGKKR